MANLREYYEWRICNLYIGMKFVDWHNTYALFNTTCTLEGENVFCGAFGRDAAFGHSD